LPQEGDLTNALMTTLTQKKVISVCAKTEDEIFAKVKDHAKNVHNMSEFSKDFYDKARSAIRDVERC